jgi:hypothetical protein
MDDHIEEDALEQYVLQSLDNAQIGAVEEHLLICGACRTRLVKLEKFISAFRAVHRDLADRPIDYTHYTESGPVRVLVALSQGSVWIASVVGEPIGHYSTVAEANLAALKSFSEEFPGHVCKGICHPTRMPGASAQ